MKSRRQFLLVGAAGALAPRLAWPQSRPVRIGMIGAIPFERSVYALGIVRALAQLGYRQGSGMALEYRSGDNLPERSAKLARELLDLKCDIIISVGVYAPVHAIQAAGSPVPVVFLAVDYDPLEKGVVTSMRKPDRNTTGIHVQQTALAAKRVEVMHEALPSARRFVTFVDDFSRNTLPFAQKAAEASRVTLTVMELSNPPYDYGAALAGVRKGDAQAFITLASPVYSSDRDKLAVLFAKHRLPSIGSNAEQAVSGFLMALGVNIPKATDRVAEIVVRILTGTKTSDIAVEQADEFEFVINAKTAKMLGVRIPESVLARATRIVS